MAYRTIHPQFEATFNHFAAIPGAIREGLWNYMAYGWPPGGFMTSVLKNDFFGVAARADHFWNGQSLKQLAKWIDTNMPLYMRGDDEAIQVWQAKTDEERRDIMIELGLRPSEFDIIAGRAVA